MGHRELLLSAARRCLEDRGYARTTARDLVAASGTNLASIGYHFGSKEALLNQAMMDAFTEYTEKLLALAAEPEPMEAGDPLDRLRQAWGVMVEMFASMRPLLVAFIEAMTQAERNPELRTQLARGYEQLRNTIAETITDMNPDSQAHGQARDAASFLIAVNDGLMVQWLLDPERSLSGEKAFDVARMIFGS